MLIPEMTLFCRIINEEKVRCLYGLNKDEPADGTTTGGTGDEEGKSHVCDWTGRRGELQVCESAHMETTAHRTHTHTHIQAHLRECAFAPVVCDLCKETMQRRLLAKHAADACVNRTVACTHCREAIQARLLSDHCNSKCQLYPVTCPNDCKQFVTRGALSTHLTSCPLQVVFCAYAHVGCTHKSSRAEMTAHLGDPTQVAHHLSLMEKHLSLTERRLSQVEQRLSMQESISVKTAASASSSSAPQPQAASIAVTPPPVCFWVCRLVVFGSWHGARFFFF